MLVRFGENSIKTVEDLAGCATDDLLGYYEQGKDKARFDCVECHKYHNPNEQRKFRGTWSIQRALGR